MFVMIILQCVPLEDLGVQEICYSVNQLASHLLADTFIHSFQVMSELCRIFGGSCGLRGW